MGKTEKRYIVRKYIMARSASEALKLENKFPGDEVFLDDEWNKRNDVTSKPMGL